MYHYETYLKFQRLYSNGIKCIKQRTYYPSVSIEEEPTMKLKYTSESFNAFYNIKGNLIHIVQFGSRKRYKYSYFYNQQDRIVKILEIDKKTNRILKENNIVYQDNDNFVESIRSYIGTVYEKTYKIKHSFEKGIRMIQRINFSEDEWFLYQKVTYDNLVEEIYDYQDNNGRTLYQISELNKNKQVIKEYFAEVEYDIDGNQIGEDINYTPDEYRVYSYNGGGLLKSVSRVSDDPWARTFDYKYNEKGHWIQKIECWDNSLEFISERKLEYFKNWYRSTLIA